MLNVKTNRDAVYALSYAHDMAKQIASIAGDNLECDAEGALLATRVLANKVAELCTIGRDAFGALLDNTPGAEDGEVSPELRGHKL